MFPYEKPIDSCVISAYAPNSDGYAHIELQKNGRRITIKHHRKVYAEYHKLSLEDMKHLVVLHKCDVRNCVNPNHLMLGTVADNNKDKQLKGRNIGFSLGNKIGAIKLTLETAKQIKADTRLSLKEAQAKYNVSAALISMIWSGKRWKDA